MNIGIVGVGYVGAVTGTCFAYMGHRVSCYDTDVNKINAFSKGILPIHEPGLEHYLNHRTTQENITFTTDIATMVNNSDLIFICIGTPSKENGDVDMGYVNQFLDEVIPLLKDDQCLVFKSTVPLGTAKHTRELIQKTNQNNVHVISNPEFLKEGTAVNDFLKPERIIIGVQSKEPEKIMKIVYEPLTRNGHPILVMDNQSAEFSKYACNTMLASRISFINEMANLCEIFGADIFQVRKALATDSRIGSKFLHPSLGYGGSCFPKDVRGLIFQATQKDYPLHITTATEQVNKRQKELLFNKFQKWASKKNIKKVSVWGTAFKPETDDIRESGALPLIRSLLDSGTIIQAHDPAANKNTLSFFKSPPNLTVTNEDHLACLSGSQALFICTEWQLYQNTPIEKITERLNQPAAIFDGRNIFRKQAVLSADMDYFGIGQ